MPNDGSTAKNTLNRRLGRQVLQYNPENKTKLFAQFCHESTHILNVFKYFVFCNKVFLIFVHFSWFIMSFFNAPLLFFIILSFTAKLPYGQLVIWQKCLWPRCLQQRCLRERRRNNFNHKKILQDVYSHEKVRCFCMSENTMVHRFMKKCLNTQLSLCKACRYGHFSCFH